MLQSNSQRTANLKGLARFYALLVFASAAIRLVATYDSDSESDFSSSSFFFFFFPATTFLTRTFGSPRGLCPSTQRSCSCNTAIRSPRFSTFRARTIPLGFLSDLSIDTCLAPTPTGKKRTGEFRPDLRGVPAEDREGYRHFISISTTVLRRFSVFSATTAGFPAFFVFSVGPRPQFRSILADW